MRYICLLLLFCCTALSACFKNQPAEPQPKPDLVIQEPATGASMQSIFPAHLDTAFTYITTQDDGHNRGETVELFLASVGLPPGNPWCAAFVGYCLEQANATYPAVRSGLARHYLTSSSVSYQRVTRENMRLDHGAIVGWKRGNTIFGHVGFVIEWQGRCGTTIEGNTTMGAGGNQFNGGGVWIRERCIEPMNHFRITWFTNVTYNN